MASGGKTFWLGKTNQSKAKIKECTMSMVLEVSGNAVKDADARATKNGDEMAIVTIAVSQRDAEGNKIGASFVPVLVFGEERVWVASRVRKGDYVVAKGAMSTPELARDGEHINYNVRVTDTDSFSFLTRKPRREAVVANAHLAPEDFGF